MKKLKKFFYNIGNDYGLMIPNRPTKIYLPTRDEVLQQLGISKEQDEQMQQKYK